MILNVLLKLKTKAERCRVCPEPKMNSALLLPIGSLSRHTIGNTNVVQTQRKDPGAGDKRKKIVFIAGSTLSKAQRRLSIVGLG